ncbi:hypothetical protein PDESU_00634 [Pontiella desulfatans]|uniref:Uncharacterized protein n=1 Tax=Pontiella desulfatans TaxID=2750659 RepID=A0A6C2TX40_PONDE|nr:lipocalin family protein [Pontiella desulfatans]VGO12084.1 hypothetical protein PDESU_00634 [Pontiella desulfatans]
MKKNSNGWTRRLAVALVLIGSSVMLSGCGGDDGGGDGEFVGSTWRVTDENGQSADFTIEDGSSFKLVMNDSGRSGSGTYTLSGEKITFMFLDADGNDCEFTGTISGNTMKGTWTCTNGRSGTWQATRR